jgi:hypothetical protein
MDLFSPVAWDRSGNVNFVMSPARGVGASGGMMIGRGSNSLKVESREDLQQKFGRKLATSSESYRQGLSVRDEDTGGYMWDSVRAKHCSSVRIKAGQDEAQLRLVCSKHSHYSWIRGSPPLLRQGVILCATAFIPFHLSNRAEWTMKLYK